MMKSLTQRARRLRHGKGESGAVQIEFILSFLLIMFVIFGIWELVMVVHAMNVLSDAAKEGVRAAIVRGTKNLGGNAAWDPIPAGCPFGSDNIKCKVWDYARFTFHDLGPSTFDVVVSYPDGVTADGHRVRVVVSYEFVPYLALPIRPRLQSAAEGRVIN